MSITTLKDPRRYFEAVGESRTAEAAVCLRSASISKSPTDATCFARPVREHSRISKRLRT